MSLRSGPSQAVKKLFEIKAGKCKIEGKLVTPDLRKGLLYLEQQDDLMHLCWKDIQTNSIVDDLIVFPEEAELVLISPVTTGRVYVLKFKSSSQRLFFWLQEPTNHRETETIARFNHVINNPPATGTVDEINASRTQSSGLQSGNEGAISSTSGTSKQTSVSIAAATTSPAAGVSNGNQPILDKMRKVLENIEVPPSEPDVELGDIITSDLVSPILKDASVTGALFPHLPPGVPQSIQETDSIIQSSQFRSALRGISYAVRSGQITPSQIGIEGDGNTPFKSVLQLLQVIQERSDRDSSAKMDTDS